MEQDSQAIPADELIARHVEPDARRPSDARLRDSGVPVWTLIGYLRLVENDPQKVADDYELPLEAVMAAIAYYQCHVEVIDARLALNAA